MDQTGLITWKQLEELGQQFRTTGTRDHLDKLLAAWKVYADKFFENHPVIYEELAFGWRELYRLIEFRNVDDGTLFYRFKDPVKARELQNSLRTKLFATYLSGEFVFVVNTELCFLGYDDYLRKARESQEDFPNGWTNMILINRLMMALECFTMKMDVSDDWQESIRLPNEHEVIVARVKDFQDDYF